MIKYNQKSTKNFPELEVLAQNCKTSLGLKFIKVNALEHFLVLAPKLPPKTAETSTGQKTPKLQTEVSYGGKPYPIRIVSSNKLTIHRRGLGGVFNSTSLLAFGAADNTTAIVVYKGGSIPQTTTTTGGKKQ